MSSSTISLETVLRTNRISYRRERTKVSPLVRRTTESSGNKYREGNGVVVLLTLDAFICTCCLHHLTGHIYQCANGHAICYNCYEMRFEKCAICRTTTPPLYRNLAMERALEVVRIPCPNAEFGCSEYLPYDDVLDERPAHLERCLFTQCPCPFRSCEFTGSYQELYEHSASKHLESLKMFKCGEILTISLASDDRVVLKEMSTEGGELVVVERFYVERDSNIISTISAKCIAPKVPGKGKFSCSLRIITSNRRLCLDFDDMERTPGVTVEAPTDDTFCPVPAFMDRGSVVKICIERKTSGNH